MSSRVPNTRRTVLARLRGTPADAEGAFLSLEPRQLFSLGPVYAAGLLSAYSTTASSAAISLPDRTPTPRVFGGGPSTSSVTTAQALMRLDAFHADSRFSQVNGAGFSSVIIDTGINRTHSFFGPDANADGNGDRIVYQYDFADNDADATDHEGHGSNVASIVGSQDPTNPGVAPAVGLIALKAFSDDGSGTFASVERALQWTIAHAGQYNIASVNLSLGDDGNYQTQAGRYGLADELATLAAMNVIVVVAAGNAYHQYQQMGLSYPASDPSVLAVGAVYAGNVGGFTYGDGAQAISSGPDYLTPFTQRSTIIPEIFAPGAPIAGAGAGSPTSIVTMHGTSQASPQIAGVAVLAQQIASTYLHRRLSPNEFRSIIMSTAATINDGDNENDNVANTGANFKRVDVLAMASAIVNLAGGANQPPSQTNHAPAMTSISTLFGGRPGRAAKIPYSLLAAAANESDPDGDIVRFKVASLTSGYLFKGNQPVVPGQTSIGPGESLIWIPPSNTSGQIEAFRLVASDGQAQSSNPVAVRVDLGSRLGARRTAPSDLFVGDAPSIFAAGAAPSGGGSFLAITSRSRHAEAGLGGSDGAQHPLTPTDLAARYFGDPSAQLLPTTSVAA